MKRLFLMRHGHAPTTHEAGVARDELRPLSAKGRADARAMALELARRGGKPALILHSPLLRAAETAKAAGEALKVRPQALQALDNTLPPEEALAALDARADGAEDLLAVGHQPQIGEIAAYLTEAVLDVRPAGLIAVERGSPPRLLWAVNVDELPGS